jgi:serine/threonine protein phosphatase PrpC
MAAAPQDEASRVTLEAWLVTDVGVVREHNEDSAYMEPANGFFIVADGMGGHAAGEVASAMAVDTVRKTLEGARSEIDSFKRTPSDAGRRSIVQLLQSAVLSAHQAVFQRGQLEADKAGMGTTLDVVLIAGPEAFVAHVGDSRTYLVRDGRSSQITTDHTVAEVLVIEGKLTIEEAQVSPLRTILVNAIGVSADVGVEMAHVTLKRGDRLLLCSDGLHDYFPAEEEIAQKLSADAPGDALKDMVELAKTRGGHDNITGVAVQVTEVIDAVPAQLDDNLTQPVDLPGANPFASDEPTETALIEPQGLPTKVTPLTPSQLRSTQPMRILEDDEGNPLATADTLPPGTPAPAIPSPAVAPTDEPPKLAPPPSAGAGDAGSGAAKAGAAKPGAAKPGAEEAGGGSEAAKAGDAKANAAPDVTTGPGSPAGGGEATAGAAKSDEPAAKADGQAAAGAGPAGAGSAGAGPAGAGPAGERSAAPTTANGAEPEAAVPAESAGTDSGQARVPAKDQDAG